jgi:RNA polymerase sigma factor (sigma-70 family)
MGRSVLVEPSGQPSAPRLRSIERGAPASASDSTLVFRVRADDDAGAFEEIFDRYGPRLLSFCRHMLGSREDAEDAVQAVFISAHRSMRSSTAELQLGPWLFTIARNRCLSMLRARRQEVRLEDAGPLPAVEGLARTVEQREDLRAMLSDMQRLPEDQRAALLLAELGAHSHEEIASILDVRPTKVRALIFQARESLASSRVARETPCAEIREQLATLRGSALRRRELRRHVASCLGCSAFEGEVARQRAAMAILLPVVPSAALKGAVLSSATVGGAAAATGIVTGGGGLVLALQSGAARLLAVAALVAGVGGSGFVAIERAEHRHHASRAASIADPGSVVPASRSIGQNRAGASPRPSVTPPAARSISRGGAVPKTTHGISDRRNDGRLGGSGREDASAPAAAVSGEPSSTSSRDPGAVSRARARARAWGHIQAPVRSTRAKGDLRRSSQTNAKSKSKSPAASTRRQSAGRSGPVSARRSQRSPTSSSRGKQTPTSPVHHETSTRSTPVPGNVDQPTSLRPLR